MVDFMIMQWVPSRYSCAEVNIIILPIPQDTLLHEACLVQSPLTLLLWIIIMHMMETLRHQGPIPVNFTALVPSYVWHS